MTVIKLPTPEDTIATELVATFTELGKRLESGDILGYSIQLLTQDDEIEELYANLTIPQAVFNMEVIKSRQIEQYNFLVDDYD